LKINKRKRHNLKKQKQALFYSVGLSKMILTKLRFENQQKKTPQSKKTKASFILFGRII